jgi:hypothetical protein
MILRSTIPARRAGRPLVACVGAALFAGALSFPAWGAAPPLAGDAPWWVPAPNWTPPKPEEHPRLFFRKTDLPSLKKRMQTPEGQAILARLKATLGGGEEMPKSVNDTKRSYTTSPTKFPFGAYTIFHGAGFGFLYQLTGDKKYAELAKQCSEMNIAGVKDVDDRYNFICPASTMRGGPSIFSLCLAYDLCYDAWEPTFRQQCAKLIMNYSQKGDKQGTSHGMAILKEMALKPNMPPGSNHYGPSVGGAGIACLTIKGDPGADDKVLDEYLKGVEANIVRAVTEGAGDHGFFHEGVGPGQIMSDTCFVPMLQAMRVAGGKDFLSTRPNCAWLTLRWAMWLVPRGGSPWFPMPHGDSGYGTAKFERAPTVSRSGQFAQGFGALANDQQKAALLWTYKNVVEPGEQKDWARYLNGQPSYDAVEYPHRAILSFVNWPIGVEPINPEKVLPKAVADTIQQYYFFRNRWKDEDDVVVSLLLGSRDGARFTRVWGLKQYIDLPSFGRGKASAWRPAEDGSGVVTCGESSFGVDFSKASGAEALIVAIGPTWSAPKTNGDRAKFTSVPLGGKTVHVLTLQTGPAPEPKAEGDTLRVGGQAVTIGSGGIVFAKMAPPPKGP